MASIRKLRKDDPQSPWVVTYTDQNGKRVQVTPKSGLQKDAKALRTKIESDLAAGQSQSRGEAKRFRDVANAYVKHCENRLGEKAIGQHRYNQIKYVIDKYLIPLLGERRCSEISFQDADNLYDSIKKGGLKPITIREYYKVAVMVERYASKRRIDFAPVLGQRCKEISASKEKIRTFNTDDIRALVASAAERPATQRRKTFLLTKCAVYLAAFCGLRFGEIMGLATQNIDFEAKQIHIDSSITRYGEIKGPKTKAGVRTVPMPQQVAEVLCLWRDHFARPAPKGLFFNDAYRKPINAAGFHLYCWRPLLKRAGLWDETGIDQYHFHALRHFAASMMVEHLIPITDVAQMMGHAKFDMTLQIYAHPLTRGHRRLAAVEAMTAAITG